MQEITKPNDILVATVNNPTSSTYDFLSAQLNPQNTSFLSKDQYKETQFVKDRFTTKDGDFDDISFNNAYKAAALHYQEMSDENYLAGLSEMEYSPFDVTRPIGSKTYNVSVEYDVDYNPFKKVYSRTGINSVDEGPLSIREIAQRGKVYDPETGEWSSVSANDRSLLDKFLGDTLVYAKWDEDGQHKDELSGQMVSHQKGDYKVDPSGNLFLEKLGNREIYGREVVNPMDMLTTDGSLFNKFDIFDADGKDKSIAKTTFKIAAEIAPFLIPGVAPVYGAVRAAVALSSVLPTFYKSFEGMLLGDEETGITQVATAAENYMAKFTTRSVSDAGQKSLFRYEQLASLTSSIFSQIYEQRAMATLSKFVMRGQAAKLNAKQAELANKINKEILEGAFVNKTIDVNDMALVQKAAMAKIPELQQFQKLQSGLSKSFSLGYMALISTADIYGEALQSGYDRRTAGFAALAAAAGQYGIMMNNRMGDWFLDKTTGYTNNVNKALMKKSVKGYLDDVQDALKDFGTKPNESKAKLAGIFAKMKHSIDDTFTSPTVIGEAMFKNAIIEGVEEVTEQAVLDATKGMIDIMNYLGLTKGDGSFGGFKNVFSKEGLENYLANLVGGILGGGMFEFNRIKIEPWVSGKALTPETAESIYQLVANGQTDALVNEINKNRSKLGNTDLSPVYEEDGTPKPAEPGQSQADLIADTAISMVQNIAGIMQSNGTAVSDNDIIKQAMIDALVIKGFEKANESNKIGVEGLIIDDMINLRSNLIRVQSEIKKLSATKEDEEKNKENISRLKKEEKVYKDEVADILAGKNSEFYFTRTIGMLNPDIFSAFMVLDRKSFTEGTYGLDYYSLPESGVGITKERIEKEWQDYLNNTNIREKSRAATNAYLKFEQEANPYAGEYTESGYSEHRKNTLKNVLDLASQIRLFGTNNDNRKRLVESYIRIAKEVETSTGRRIIPWDPIVLNLADTLIEQGLLSSTDIISEDGSLVKQKITPEYWNEEVKIGESTSTRGELVKNVLNRVISSLPAEALSYDMMVDIFNEAVFMHNTQVQAEMDKLTKTITPENEEEVQKELKELESTILKVQLDTYESSDYYLEQTKKFEPELIVKQNELGLSSDDVLKIRNKNIQNLPESLELFSEVLNKIAKENDIAVSDLSSEEIRMALSNHISAYTTLNPNDDTISGLLKTNDADSLDKVIKIMDDFSVWYNSTINKYKEFGKKVEEINKTIEKPEIFDVNNYMIDAVIKEITQSKNLDKELLVKVQDAFKNIVDYLKAEYFKEYEIDTNDFFDLLVNAKEIEVSFSKFLGEEKEFGGEENSIPPYLLKIYKSVNNDQFRADSIATRISDIVKALQPLTKTIDKLNKLKEIIDNNDNFISNSIYDFLEKLELHLYKFSPTQKATVFSILKEEELSLLSSSEITNYLTKGIRDQQIKQALNVLKMAESVIVGMSRTEVGLEDPTGFIYSRQQFAKKHNLESEIANLKTVDSATATMILADINRIKIKLGFLTDLSKSNYGMIFNEQETMRNIFSREFANEIKKISDEAINIKGKPLIPDLSDIINSSDSNEKKLLKIEEAIFNHFKDWSKEDKIEAAKVFIEKIKYTNSIDLLYRPDGSDLISKDLKQINKNDFLMGILTAMTVSSKDMTNRFLQVFNSGFKKSPFFSQELAVKIMYASTVDPDLFALASETNLEKDSLLTDEITYVLGNAGVGKTSVIFKLFLNILKPENPNLSVWFAAPHRDQSLKLKADVLRDEDTSKFNSTEDFNKKELFERLHIQNIINDLNNPSSENIERDPDNADHIRIKFENIIFDPVTDLPNIIMIDEGTHFTAIELAVLNELVKSSRKVEGGIYTKIVVAGDPTQNGAESMVMNGNMYNIDRVSGTFAPLLTLSVRSANSQKRANADMLSALVRKSIGLYTSAKETSKVTQLIGQGISLKYHSSNKKFNGDYLTTEKEIPLSILKAIKNNIDENSNIIIGILSLTPTLDSYIKDQLDNAGISEANYKIFTPDKVQGSELDYFIMPISLVRGRNIVRSLRKLYTFTTRSKKGTIIINDEDVVNEDKTQLVVWSEHQDFSDEIDPINEEILEENKKARQETIKALLDNTFGISNPMFVFDNNGKIMTNEELENNINDSNIKEETTQEKIAKIQSPKDDYNYMLHSFYNDLNVSFKEVDNNVVLTRRKYDSDKSKISYGLDPFVTNVDNNSPTETITLSKEDFNKLTEEYVSLKYDIWTEKAKTGKFKIPSSNAFFNRLVPGYTSGPFNKGNRSQLIIRKTVYDKDFNNPYDKFLDDPSKHLETGDAFLNLFLRVNLSGSDTNPNYYYIHLSTLPTVGTTNNFFSTVVGPNNLSGPAYKNFIDNLTVDEDVLIDDSKIDIKTGTRTLKKDSENKKETLVYNTLEVLRNMKGLKFYDSKKSIFSKTPKYFLFPSLDSDNSQTNFNEFAKIWKRHSFNREFSDDKLKEMHLALAGKPYAIVSFVESEKHAEIILLKSKTRSFAEIRNIVKNPYNDNPPKSLKQHILSGDDAKKVELRKLTGNLFSANQVLDMLIDLAVENKSLFNKFFVTGQQIINETYANSIASKKFISEYLSAISPEVDKDLLTHIAYSGKSDDRLKQIFFLIKQTVEDNKDISKKDLKAKVINIAKGSKLWYNRFWNFFSFRNIIEEMTNAMEHDPNFDILKDLITQYKTFGEIMDTMINHWENNMPKGIYHNVVIRKEAHTYVLDETEADLKYLYSSLTPEGLYAMIDLSDKINPTVNINPTTSESQEIKEGKEKLLGIKYNDISIIEPEAIETLTALNNKINKAKLIRDILIHPNISKSKDNYTLDILKKQSMNKLNNIITELSKLIEKPFIEKVTELSTQIKELNNLNDSERDFGTNFGKLIERVFFEGVVEATDKDIELLTAIVNSSDKKIYPAIYMIEGTPSLSDGGKVTLLEFLRNFPISNVEANNLLNPKGEYENGTPVSIMLSNFIREVLQNAKIFDSSDINLDFFLTDDLFSECNI